MTNLCKTLLLLLLFPAGAAAQHAPTPLTGNWLRTDGSNQFILGVYDDVICYKNETRKTGTVTGAHGHWQISTGSDKLDIVLKDRQTMLLTVNGKLQTLKTTLTYNDHYQPVQRTFRQPLFGKGVATVKGYIHGLSDKARRLTNSYIQVSYENVFTGETEYFTSAIDRSGQFNISFPVFKPQLCTLRYNDDNVATFFVQAGNTMLVAVNNEIKAAENDAQALQRVCVMGDDETFNNHYQYYRAYFDKAGDTASLDHLYPAGQTEQRFLDYVREEIRYSKGSAFLNKLSYTDTTQQQEAYKNFLEDAPPTALIHDSYYKLAGYYATKQRYGVTRGMNRIMLSFNKLKERIKNDYSAWLPAGFQETFERMLQDTLNLNKMKEPAILRTYFNGDAEAARTYQQLLRSMENELFREFSDSVAYAVNKALFTDVALRFAANQYHLFYGGYLEEEAHMPTVYRLDLLRQFSDQQFVPWRLADSLSRARNLQLAGVGLFEKIQRNNAIVKQLDNEADWQQVLKRYRGKVVVIWTFPHYFRQEQASRSLYELQQMQALYKGKNVVFLTLIEQRQRSDKAKALAGYLELMGGWQGLQDVYYVSRKISAIVLMSEAINNKAGIYNTAGQAHHPSFYQQPFSQERWDALSLDKELDTVLAGKGHYYEAKAAYFFTHEGSRRNFDARLYAYGPSPSKTWTRLDSSGAYQVFMAKAPERPEYAIKDSAFQMIGFVGDSLYEEHQQIYRAQSGRSLPEFAMQGIYSYQYQQKEQLLSIYNRSDMKTLRRRYRVLMISPDILVLEQE